MLALRSVATTLTVCKVVEQDGWRVTLTNAGEQTALLVWLEDDRAVPHAGYVYFHDNYFSLFPNESRTIQIKFQGVGAGERRIRIKGWNTSEVVEYEKGGL